MNDNADWDFLCKQRMRLDHHWKEGRFQTFHLPDRDHTREGHSSAIYLIHICGNYLVSGGLDKFVRIWDLESDV